MINNDLINIFPLFAALNVYDLTSDEAWCEVFVVDPIYPNNDQLRMIWSTLFLYLQL
jgi:hypothetical protein